MSLGTTYANLLLQLELNAVAIANLADNAASAPATNLYLSLHTASPVGGDQTTSEIAYTGYARVAVSRSAGGILIVGTTGTLVADAVFGAMTAGAGGTVTHIGFGRASSGAGLLMRSAAVTNLPVTTGVTPRIRNTTTFTLA